MSSRTTRVGAHRGAMCYAPENSLAAIELAIQMGTHRIEIDVRETVDGALVLMHDARIDRTTTGAGEVKLMEHRRLQQCRLLDGEPVPTLAEALRCVRGRAKLLLEIKDTGYTAHVKDHIRHFDTTRDVIVSSFHECVLDELRARPPQASCVFQLEEKPIDVEKLQQRFGMRMICANWKSLTAEEVERAHRLRVLVRVGLPDDLTYGELEPEVVRLARMGVDEISCGRPDWIAAALKQRRRYRGKRTGPGS